VDGKVVVAGGVVVVVDRPDLIIWYGNPELHLNLHITGNEID